jgi:small subunit ribosomal protein S9
MEETTEKTPEKTIPEVASATGRRKEAVCRVNLKAGKGVISINGQSKEEYLCRDALVINILRPLQAVDMVQKVDIDAKVRGGGVSGQSGAIRLAIARALTYFDPQCRATLKKAGLLTVDARKVERKKYGQPKARKRFQFSKR